MSTTVTYIGGPEDGRRILRCCGSSLAPQVKVTADDGSETVYRLERFPESGGMRNIYVVSDARAGQSLEYLLLRYADTTEKLRSKEAQIAEHLATRSAP